MAQYKIVKANDDTVVSHNSRELKRRIKSSLAKHKAFTGGMYKFLNREGKACFQVEYSISLDGKNPTLKGKQSNIKKQVDAVK